MVDTGAMNQHDPGMVALAAELAGSANHTDRRPFIVGVVGSVAAGKSTTAAGLATLLGQDHHLWVEVVPTDSFLLPNAQLEALGGVMVKGHPQSYDWAALSRFLTDADAGEPVLAAPVYSHEEFDIVAGAQQLISSPDVLVVEGLNLLQAPPTAPVDVTQHLDRSVYLHAPAEVLEGWFVHRFIATARQDQSSPDAFYAMFAGMDRAEIDSIARWTWREINAPNLERYIEPTRARADVVVHHGPDHSIRRIEHQRPSRG